MFVKSLNMSSPGAITGARAMRSSSSIQITVGTLKMPYSSLSRCSRSSSIGNVGRGSAASTHSMRHGTLSSNATPTIVSPCGPSSSLRRCQTGRS